MAIARKLIIVVLAAVAVAVVGFAFADRFSRLKPIDPSSIERITDTRDPNTISGSALTARLDCTYKNPPPTHTAIAVALDCKSTTHNVKILASEIDYFIPRSTSKDEPPYCLVKPTGRADALVVARERQRMYCQREWPWWKRILS
jgi:hypothetical protein